MRCVPARDFNVAKAMAWRSAIHDDPPYQREGTAWSLDKQQLFIDSLLNGYDVPKIYLHDLRGQHPTLVYTVVDGRQRLTAIWSFLTDGFPLADDFRVEPANRPRLPDGVRDPVAGERFSSFDPRWKEVLRRTPLAVVLIQNAAEPDIEDLFSRLNNGEPLSAAEHRNAIGGEVARLVRELARHPLFADRVAFPDERGLHREVATRLLLLEHANPAPGDLPPDLGSRALDAFVRENRRLRGDARDALRARAVASLDRLAAVFRTADPLLAKPGVLPVYALALREPAAAGADPAAVRSALEAFEATRVAALQEPGGGDPALVEFTSLTQHGTHEPRSLARRLEILRDAVGGERHGVQRNP